MQGNEPHWRMDEEIAKKKKLPVIVTVFVNKRLAFDLHNQHTIYWSRFPDALATITFVSRLSRVVSCFAAIIQCEHTF